MARYFALSTVLVLGFLAIALALPRCSTPRDARYATGSPAAGVRARQPSLAISPPPVVGAAPWALSALPECFRQVRVIGGSPHDVRPRIAAAAGAKLVRIAHERLHIADCTLDIGSDTATLTRGDNRLVVPAFSTFYLAAGRLILDRIAHGREDLRIYTPAGAATFPAFVPFSRVHPKRLHTES